MEMKEERMKNELPSIFRDQWLRRCGTGSWWIRRRFQMLMLCVE